MPLETIARAPSSPRRRRVLEAVGGPLHDFYAQDARRARSVERDLGLRWRSRDGSTYRVAWIADTRELYSVEHASTATVTVLARVDSSAVEHAAEHWREVCNSDLRGSYEWLLEQVGSRRARGAKSRRARNRRSCGPEGRRAERSRSR